MSINFFWIALIGGVVIAALCAGVGLAAQWRETNWKEDED
jgi:hypothetical protein